MLTVVEDLVALVEVAVWGPRGVGALLGGPGGLDRGPGGTVGGQVAIMEFQEALLGSRWHCWRTRWYAQMIHRFLLQRTGGDVYTL